MKRVRHLLAELSGRVHPRLLSPLASVLVSLRRRELCTVRIVAGDWIHRYRAGTVVQPVLGGASARLQDQTAQEVFLYGYRPGAGDTVVELGAGVGGEVRLLSRLVGPSGRVISVEPHPRTFRCLRRTIELNRLDNVTALQCAVTGIPGPVHIEDGECHIANALTSDQARGVTVPGETFAGIVERVGVSHIDLLKMNIEGAELSVLEAARDLLPTVRNVVVSCHDFRADRGGADWQRTYLPVRALLTDAGYTVRSRTTDPRPWIPYYLYAAR